LQKRDMVPVGVWVWEDRGWENGAPNTGQRPPRFAPGGRRDALGEFTGHDLKKRRVQSSKEILRGARSRGSAVAGQCWYAEQFGSKSPLKNDRVSLWTSWTERC
jgi:hypothetical protein